MTMSPGMEVTVIIPTLCEYARRPSLLRAIASLYAQTLGVPRILVVVNGSRYDLGLLEELRGMPHVEVLQLELGSLPNALKQGRMAVKSAYFGFLDDDDEYLPDTLAQRLACMQDRPELALVACQGWRGQGPAQTLAHEAPDPTDLLSSLVRSNWLASCGGLYRTARVEADCFVPEMAGLEWTYLAVRLCLRGGVAYLPAPGFCIHPTPGSVSLSAGYVHRAIGALNAILALPLPESLRRAYARRLGQAHHDAAELMLAEGRWRAAWSSHWACLRRPGGWRFLPFTRHLLRLP